MIKDVLRFNRRFELNSLMHTVPHLLHYLSILIEQREIYLFKKNNKSNNDKYQAIIHFITVRH